MKIKEARRIIGLSQQKVSDIYGIPRRTLQDWEAELHACPQWCENLVVEKLLNYTGNGYMTLYSVVSFSCNSVDEFEEYLGFNYEKAIDAYINNDTPNAEIRIFRIPSDTDKRDKDEIINAMGDGTGYDLMEV